MIPGKVKWPLFTKFAFGISLTVALFGTLNAIIVRNSVSNALNHEFEKRGYFITRAMAEQSVGYILNNDPAGLNMLINDMMAIDTTIHYAFIVSGQHEVLAHSFRNQVPPDLINLNWPAADDQPGIMRLSDTHNPDLIIRDFSMASMDTGLGVVRIGILENEILAQVRMTLWRLWFMIAIFFLLGLLAALFFSYTIASPLRALSMQSASIEIRSIQAGIRNIRESTMRPYFRLRRLFGMDDEIDVLYQNYSNMLQRLEDAYLTMNRLQQSLLQSEKLASIGTLTAGVAHEINNPLAGIGIGLKRIAKNPENTAQVREYTLMMQEALSRIEQVIKDLLTFSRKGDLSYEVVNVCDIIKQAVKLAEYRIKSRKVNIVIDYQACNVQLQAAQNRIEQVFLNIIINAIDSVAERMEVDQSLKGEIVVTAENDEQWIRVIFRDNGIGISKAEIGKIFDPFYTTKVVGEGTGLGLSVSYQIIRDHGGQIKVNSEPGEGSTFYVILPKQQ